MIKDPNNRSLIFKVESEIKNKWSYYSPFIKYSSLPFSDSFSELLTLIHKEKIQKKMDLVVTFRRLYTEFYNKYDQLITYNENLIHNTEVVKHSKLNVERLDNSEILILFNHLSNPKKTKTKKLIDILSRVKCDANFSDEEVLKIISRMNLPALYLIDKMGFKCYKEFSDLIDLLGIHYSSDRVPDSSVILKVKESLVSKFTESISKLELQSISAIEKLIFQ